MRLILLITGVFVSMAILGIFPKVYCQSISIRIEEVNSGMAIPYAYCHVPALDTVLIADQTGEMWLPQLPDDLLLEFGARGYESWVATYAEVYAKPMVRLSLSTVMLQTILIEDHAKHEDYLSSVHLGEKFFSKQQSTTVAQALQIVPGIQVMETGPGIAKPMIRGLYGQRILINKDYIRQEGHQWGNDHGLEIDVFDLQRVEIIKGPASLLYGSDAIGGVVNIMPEPIPALHSAMLSVGSNFKSNNIHWGKSIAGGASGEKWFGTFRLSRQTYGDFRVPAESFNYGGFALPLLNGLVKNTAGEELNWRFGVGMRNHHAVSRLNFSQYSLQGGLFSGAVGIPRFYTLMPDDNRRNVDIPFQRVLHRKLVFNHMQQVSSGHWTFNMGWQQNLRAEHSNPDAHTVARNGEFGSIATQWRLNTWYVESHYEREISDKVKWITGMNGMHQRNLSSGFDFLFPDFLTFRSGIFSLVEIQWSEQSALTGGIRYDVAHNSLDSFSLRRVNRQGSIIQDTVSPMLDRWMHNWSASLGYRSKLFDHWNFKVHVGKSFRVPYPVELASNGMHHGYFRHERGNIDLESEHGYQLDMGLDLNAGNLSMFFSPYFNYFKGFIYLRPSPFFSPLPEGGLLFEYTQHDAIYTGVEWGYNWVLSSYWVWSQSFEYVHTYNIQTGLALPFTPPPSLLQILSWEKDLKNCSVETSLQYRFTLANGANRTDRNEAPTPGFHIVNFTGSVFLKYRQNISFHFQVLNLFNQRYLNHLSRYRILNLPEMGRNIVLAFHMPLTWKLAKHPK